MNGVCVVDEKEEKGKRKKYIVTYNNDRKFTVRSKYRLGKERSSKREPIEREWRENYCVL